MRASSWASTTTRRARSVNRSNMRVSSKALVGSLTTTPNPAYAFRRDRLEHPLRANKGRPGFHGLGETKGAEHARTESAPFRQRPRHSARSARRRAWTEERSERQRASDE